MFSVKDIRKLVVVSIIGACAVFVANLFLNFYLDIEQLEISKTNPMIQTYYDAQVSLSWMVAMVSGVVLSLTSILLMCFYIKQFVDDHKEQLGILKALGYSNGQLAKRFWAFGLSFGAGALLGYFASFLMMGHFYDFRNEKGILPEITIHFHWQLLLTLVILPTTFFMVLAIGYARRQLQTPALLLLKKSPSPIKVKRRKRAPKKEKDFLKELSLSLIWGRKSILFFVVFGSMCFAAMVQLSFGLRDYTDDIIQTMMIMIGLIFSQRAMLTLIEKGMTREQAYDLVQPKTAQSWDNQVDFKPLLEADPEVTSRLTQEEIDEIFNPTYYTKRVDEIFERIGLGD